MGCYFSIKTSLEQKTLNLKTMKAIISLFMLVSVEAFSQGIIIHQQIHVVQLFTVNEFRDSSGLILYQFSNPRFFAPIRTNATTWRINVPINEFTMALIDNKEWIGIKPNNERYDVIVPFMFDDGLMTVVNFDISSKKYVDNFYGDLVYYNPK